MPEQPTPTRRTVLRTTAWSLPAVSVAAAAPAFASSEDNPRVSLNAVGTLYSRTGVAGIRARVASSTNRPLAGRFLTASLPTEGNVAFADGTRAAVFGPTDNDGWAAVPVITTPALASNMSESARTLRISLAGPSGEVATTLQIAPHGRGMLANVTSASQMHRDASFDARHKGAYYTMQATSGMSGNTLYLTGPQGVMNTASAVASFVYGAVADPVLSNGQTLVTHTSRYAVTTVAHPTGTYYTPTAIQVGQMSVGDSDWGVTPQGPGVFSVRGALWVHDPSLTTAGEQLTSSYHAVASRRTLAGVRTVSWSDSVSGHFWRGGQRVSMAHVPARSTPVGEDVFLEPNKVAIVRGTTRYAVPGLTAAYAAIVGTDTVATVWYTIGNTQMVWMPDGTHRTFAVPAPPTSLASATTTPLGHGYYRRGGLHYFEGKEVFWGDAQPVVTASGVSLWGNT